MKSYLSKHIIYVTFTLFVFGMTILELSLLDHKINLQKFLLLNFGPHLFYWFLILGISFQLKLISRRNHRFLFYKNFLSILAWTLKFIGILILLINLVEIVKSCDYTRFNSCSMGAMLYASGNSLSLELTDISSGENWNKLK
jgi:prepilin signal peptidase PulO-like enzyme (type II secretory pathway)